MVLMSNQGEVHAFSTHSFRRYLKTQCVRAADIAGITSTVLSRRGEGFFQRSSSEWQRFSVSAAFRVAAECTLELPEGARPPPPEEQPKPDEAAEEPKKDEGEAAAEAASPKHEYVRCCRKRAACKRSAVGK